MTYLDIPQIANSLLARGRAFANLFPQYYGAYHAGVVDHDPAQFMASMAAINNDWNTILGRTPPAPNPFLQPPHSR